MKISNMMRKPTVTRKHSPSAIKQEKNEFQKYLHKLLFVVVQLTGALVMVYSRVLNCGISSAGWFCSEMAAYCGGKVFLTLRL